MSSDDIEASSRLDYPLALLLAALAGCVDAVGFIHWHGLFVSFMSGNSTMLGVTAVRGDAAAAALAASILGGFVAGVVIGECLSSHGRPVVLMAETCLLAAAAIAIGRLDERLVAPVLSAAMGAQNASVHRAAGISVALTYVTGTLVHIGRSIAAALTAGSPLWAGAPYAGLWVSLIAGSVAGATAAVRSEAGTLGVAAAATLILGAILIITGDARPARRSERA